jgi:hypothetical protein
MMGLDYVSELRSPTGPTVFIPGWYVSMEGHGGDDDAGWG